MPTFTPLPGSDRTLLPNSRPAGAVDSSEMNSLTIRVRSCGAVEALAAKAYELAATPLADRQYLTHDELAAQHGASREDLDAVVERYAQEHDLTVAHRSAAARTVVVRGKLGDLVSAFPAHLRLYHHASGTYRGRTGDIRVPEQLAGVVTGVFGFDTRPKHRAPHHGRRMMTHGGPGAANGVSAAVFAERYKFPTKASDGRALDGAGQTIAIIELGGGFRSNDLKLFFKEIGVPLPKVTSISVDHAVNAPSTPGSADGEVMLDVEVAGAVAPGANIAVYFAPNGGDKGFLDAISAAIHDTQRKPSVISISWGSPEVATDQQGLDAYHELFAAAGALGITICVASGDHGAADLDADHWDGKIHVDHPACDDLVLGCGGTQIDGGNDVVWNDGTTFEQRGGWAGGGGVSTIFPVPAYQKNLKPFKSIDTQKPGRGVPDIAMSATSYFTRVDNAEGASGGTSAVAPLMAGLVARLNQAKQKNVGFLNPFLYANADKGIVTDVTSGTTAFGKVKGYKARAGWDECTGLGTPVGDALLSTLG